MAEKMPKLTSLSKWDLLRLIARLQDRYHVQVEPRDIAHVCYQRYRDKCDRLLAERDRLWEEFVREERSECGDALRQTQRFERICDLQQRIRRASDRASAFLVMR